ncbi:hypothetical protein IHE45_12G046300 [Dioscorea alata]|uniref:Uncharacterized protein n=1 Tax=Dioscorea alata TaxID=55571 RepID=A0ACB7V1U6_DIOAL|nr:hypothetical protein IHE45_12G046300 [Dioscorea alata]
MHAIDIIGLQGKINNNAHKCHTGVQRRRQHIHIPCPPILILPIHHKVEDKGDDEPRHVMHCFRRRHACCYTDNYRHINEPNPFLFRECFCEKPNWYLSKHANEEEVVHVLVDAEVAEHSARAYDSPDD